MSPGYLSSPNRRRALAVITETLLLHASLPCYQFNHLHVSACVLPVLDVLAPTRGYPSIYMWMS